MNNKIKELEPLIKSIEDILPNSEDDTEFFFRYFNYKRRKNSR